MFADTAAATITVQDSYVASSWGFTDWQWAALTNSERVELRSSIAYAPNLCTEGK